ncbi:MAG TPA: hypothetical protein VF543_22070 [Pyrinomonadaceae bacterium]|jgi:hypothetical protein
MNSNNNLTDTERSILDEVRKLLGSNLVSFLLSGLGGTEIIHRRRFAAHGIPSQEDEITYRLEMISDSEQGLPIGYDPLVLAALLDILWERQPLNGKVTFRDSDICEKLDWPQEPESHTLIKQSIERYVATSYFLIDPTIPERRSKNTLHASFRRLIIGYETDAVLLPLKRTTSQRFIKVQFLPELIYDLISDKKLFLGLNFTELNSLQPIPPRSLNFD